MSAFNFESGSGKQSDDFLFSKKNKNNNDNKNTLRFDEILDLTEQNDKQQDTKKDVQLKYLFLKTGIKSEALKGKLFFERSFLGRRQCSGRTCLKNKRQFHMALEHDVKGQHTDIDIEYCGNAVS